MAKTTNETEELLSLTNLSRHLSIPYAKAIDLLREGVIKADFTSDRYYFFRPDRLEELRGAVDETLGTTQHYNQADNIIERRPKK